MGGFKKGVPGALLCRGYACALRYHLGSLCLGSFLELHT